MRVTAKAVLYNSVIGLAAILSSILIVLVFPIILILRFIVVIGAKCFRRDLESIVSGLDMFFLSDIGHWDTKPEHSMVFTMTMGSKLPNDKVEEFFEGALTEKRNKRLSRYIVPWMGFAFFKKEASFLLDNHLFELDDGNGEVRDEKWRTNFVKTLLKKPYAKNQSPWEFYIVSNYQTTEGSENESMIVTRFHHALGDGYSLLKLFASTLDDYVPIVDYDNPNEDNAIVKFFRQLTTALFSPFHLMKLYFLSTDFFNKQWRSFSGEISTADAKINVEKILLVRRKFSAGVTPIILSGITTAIRNILLRRGSKIPQKIHIGIPLPRGKRPDHIGNHVTGVSFPLPVGTSDPVERLLNINTDFEKFLSSQLPALSSIGIAFVGRLPYWISTRISKIYLSAAVTIVPLGAQQKFFGVSIADMAGYFPIPFVEVDAGIAIMVGINDGLVYFNGTFDKNIVASDQLANEIFEDITKHFDSLLKN